MKQQPISKEAESTLELIGDFGPTVHAEDRRIKGWVHSEDGGRDKHYLDADQLREMAKHLVEVADWLDKRAALPALREDAFDAMREEAALELAGDRMRQEQRDGERDNNGNRVKDGQI